MRLVCCAPLLLAATAHAQEPKVDPNRVFTTPLHWSRVVGAPRSEPLRVADGSLAILYQDGTYAAVTASFIRSGREQHVGLNLNEGEIVRLGTWTKTDDDMIRIESREVLREKMVQRVVCAPKGQNCHPVPEAPLPAPTTARTCRLDKPSVEHLSDMIYCNGGAGLTLVHPAEPVDLADLPNILAQLRKTVKEP